jgi:hypothetical protein
MPLTNMEVRSFGERRSSNDIGWRAIACSTPTIFPMSQYIPPKGFSAAIYDEQGFSAHLTYRI